MFNGNKSCFGIEVYGHESEYLTNELVYKWWSDDA